MGDEYLNVSVVQHSAEGTELNVQVHGVNKAWAGAQLCSSLIRSSSASYPPSLSLRAEKGMPGAVSPDSTLFTSDGVPTA